MEYNRLDNESDKDLINRICSEKDNIGSWQDVANVINNPINIHLNTFDINLLSIFLPPL